MPKNCGISFRDVEKHCLLCGNKLKLNNTRDIIRKKFCCRQHSTKYFKDLKIIHCHRQSEDARKKMSEAAIRNGRWIGEGSPNYGGRLSKGRRCSEKNKELARQRMLAGGARKARLGNKSRSSIQLIVEKYLTDKGIQHLYEYPIPVKLVDIYIDKNMIIECDGDYWHSFPHIIEKDRTLDEWCAINDYKILRLREKEIRTGEYKIKLDDFIYKYIICPER